MKDRRCLLVIATCLLLLQAGSYRGHAATMKTLKLGPDVQVFVEEAREGVIHCRVKSPYQPGTTLVRILPPDKPNPPERRRVLFVLPVEPKLADRYGDGLVTVKRLNLHNRLGFVVVAPTFAQWPWYADHPTDPTIRQESYMMKVVVPLAERLYPHRPARRGLLGFSKSGWGAFSLLLRHSDQFGAAVAWDAPMMMTRPGYGMAGVTGTQENFERYRIPRLLTEHAASVSKTQRLGLFGYGNFRGDVRQAHALMERLGIPHDYADGPRRKHHWDSGWVETAVEALHRMTPLRPASQETIKK